MASGGPAIPPGAQIFSPQKFFPGREINSSSSFLAPSPFSSGREPTQLSSPDGGKVQQPKERRGGGLIREPSQSLLGLPFSISSARKPHSTHLPFSSQLLPLYFLIAHPNSPLRLKRQPPKRRCSGNTTPWHAETSPQWEENYYKKRGPSGPPSHDSKRPARQSSHGSAVTDLSDTPQTGVPTRIPQPQVLIRILVLNKVQTPY